MLAGPVQLSQPVCIPLHAEADDPLPVVGKHGKVRLRLDWRISERETSARASLSTGEP